MVMTTTALPLSYASIALIILQIPALLQSLF